MTIVTKDNYKAEVENSDKLVVVDFWASWCGPCRMLAPIMESISEEMTDVKFCKINVDDEPGLASKYGIMNIPTLVFIMDGSVVQKLVGYRAKEEIVAVINELK